MSTFAFYDKNLPDYYPTMFMDGYSPEQIWESHRRKMYEQLAEREQITEIKITSEIKLR